MRTDYVREIPLPISSAMQDLITLRTNAYILLLSLQKIKPTFKTGTYWQLAKGCFHTALAKIDNIVVLRTMADGYNVILMPTAESLFENYDAHLLMESAVLPVLIERMEFFSEQIKSFMENVKPVSDGETTCWIKTISEVMSSKLYLEAILKMVAKYGG